MGTGSSCKALKCLLHRLVGVPITTTAAFLLPPYRPSPLEAVGLSSTVPYCGSPMGDAHVERLEMVQRGGSTRNVRLHGY